MVLSKEAVETCLEVITLVIHQDSVTLSSCGMVINAWISHATVKSIPMQSISLVFNKIEYAFQRGIDTLSQYPVKPKIMIQYSGYALDMIRCVNTSNTVEIYVFPSSFCIKAFIYAFLRIQILSRIHQFSFETILIYFRNCSELSINGNDY